MTLQSLLSDIATSGEGTEGRRQKHDHVSDGNGRCSVLRQQPQNGMLYKI